MNKTLFLLASASMLLVGCASTYQQRDMNAPTTALDSTKSVLVSVPPNGQFGQTVYEQSGTMTAEAIVAAFSKYAPDADIISGCTGEDCLSVVDGTMCGYLVMPIIRHWEDRATEWSGKSDRIEIQLVIFDASSKKEIANSTYTGKSKWMTFGGDHPQDLLAEPTEDLVSDLYGQSDSRT